MCFFKLPSECAVTAGVVPAFALLELAVFVDREADLASVDGNVEVDSLSDSFVVKCSLDILFVSVE
jgi:hypothetical protein